MQNLGFKPGDQIKIATLKGIEAFGTRQESRTNPTGGHIGKVEVVKEYPRFILLDIYNWYFGNHYYESINKADIQSGYAFIEKV